MAEQTLEERLARTLARYSIEPWDDLSPENRAGYEDDARAVLAEIEAMGLVIVPREPTEDIIEAVQIEVDIWPEDKPKPFPNYVQFVSREEAIGIWQAGIAAALASPPAPEQD